jgi:hypothetical protein
MRVQVAAAVAKAAAARFVQDDVDDGLPIHNMYERKLAGRALDMPDLPLIMSSHKCFSVCVLCVVSLLCCFLLVCSFHVVCVFHACFSSLVLFPLVLCSHSS